MSTSLASSNNDKGGAEIINEAIKWTAATRKDMIAAVLMDPSLIAFRSIALDVPEVEIRRKLEQQLCEGYKPPR
ncbi:hypothetical protein TVAG_349900 [Trichomonas vaginalis G3]|uniref:Uncharacterized protein n=1 Tax=Trichomonas vaginalis (strain ATCC PRA-98 / G3) TaxID=412133 RepID=A2FR13_TRIV3|nr:hypothetical protein TVAGG3_0415830 [Trichomonas vaginalis G3]EAX92643.1 hypothetical protein TVAG_349900 [Trichomonas vaginalis G3]KAI5535692.1 hypothetical protein TVAGG3_0415830 [Trichomonas vaginalis G3]|eukprot:XP_001305573.1 hypothetical protein [Trichomonas vaginalis G3]